MVLMQLLGIGPLGEWTWADDWVKLLAPFGLAAVWWTWSDWSGYTRRKAMARDDERRLARRQKSVDALGLKTGGRK